MRRRRGTRSGWRVLRPPERRAIEARLREGARVIEITAELGCSRGTVWADRHRGAAAAQARGALAPALALRGARADQSRDRHRALAMRSPAISAARPRRSREIERGGAERPSPSDLGLGHPRLTRWRSCCLTV